MLTAAVLVGAASFIGVALFGLYPWVKPTGRVWSPGAVHGAIGVAGFAAFVWALDATPPMDPDGLGLRALCALALCLAAGLWLFAARWMGKRLSSTAVTLHVAVAIAGIVLMARFVSS
jgi:hypothetical protein